MSAKARKSVLGEGSEFGWVGGTPPANSGDKKENGQESAPGAAASDEGEAGQDAAEEAEPEPKRRRGPGRRNRDATPRRQVAKETSRQDRTPLQKVSFYLEQDTAMELKMQALREKRSASAIVQEVISKYLRRKAAG